ncbi:MAG TPA: amidohydrolase family protein [Spirochaetales bacterium]|nr:amidohydrolase family protein [Spirochaetales bacterium]HRY55698.1 amidohydrolase family protein [Spirochaetia bacterium]HRZ64424.1 amidohydrolase family protein [Spirochaetia bacterium]
MIDAHAHPLMVRELVEGDPALARAVREVWGLLFPPQPLEVFLREMDEAGVDRAVLLPVDCTTAHGCCLPGNEAIARLAERSDRFIGFASVDPALPDAERRLERAVRGLGLRGLKLDPALQRFDPGDRERAFPLYRLCGELGVPVVVHAGMSWAPRGLASFARPFLLEEAVQSFPGVNFVLPHLGWPWTGEALMLALKYRNVFLDTSVIYARTPREALAKVVGEGIGVPALEGSIPGQLLFGSNYPRQDMRRAVRGLKSLGLSDALYRAATAGNAARLLGLGGGAR